MERFTCKMYVIVLMSRTDKHQTSILGGFWSNEKWNFMFSHGYASANSSSAHPSQGNRGAFSQVVRPSDGALTILSRPRAFKTRVLILAHLPLYFNIVEYL